MDLREQANEVDVGKNAVTRETVNQQRSEKLQFQSEPVIDASLNNPGKLNI